MKVKQSYNEIKLEAMKARMAARAIKKAENSFNTVGVKDDGNKK